MNFYPVFLSGKSRLNLSPCTHFNNIFCYRKWLAEKTSHRLHEHPVIGIGKRIPFQQISLQTQENRDRCVTRPH